MTHTIPTSTTCSRPWLSGLCLALLLAASGSSLATTRIKEVAAIEGVRSNQLTGFGLVVGLDGTGDQT
ncbi:MAG: flagellar basal body P-ring protein FlgI, partial [Rhodoferax sp.]